MGAGWQHAMADWIQQWEWLEDCEETLRIAWLELMIAFELQTGLMVPGDAFWAKATTKHLHAQMGVGKETSKFRQ